MRMPDRWDWNDWIDPEDRKPVGPNEEHLIRWGLTVVFSLFLASLCPIGTVPVMLGGLLLMAANVAAVAAALREDPVDASHLTLWDEAAASAALGLLALIASPLLRALPLAAAEGA
ncbi:MAG TPA: hypothetical protein VD978_05410 [Azospirillum sp.]|nr:hypothetical protein [Azospirillum sp.]